MNKLPAIALSLLLSACVSSPDLRPDPYLKSEALLQQGISAYKNDNFSEAQQKFSQALEFYCSFDNHKGIMLAQLNLAETALASSDFANAELYLQKLKQQTANGALEAEVKRKIILLEVKLQFEQQHYRAALASLQPLLMEVAAQKKPDDAQLNLWAMQARLEVLISPLAQSNGLDKFTTAVAQINPQPANYQALLKRTLAAVSLKRGNYPTAANLLTEALAYYKTQANRRAIASCLEELGSVEIAQRHPQAAQDYLERALVIRVWLKDEYKSGKIRQQLTIVKSMK